MAQPPPRTQILSDILAAGVSQQVDRRHRNPFQLTVAENARLPAPGRYTRRKGLRFLERNVEGESDLSNENVYYSSELAENGSETVLIRPEGLYTHLPTYGKFDKRGDAISHTIEKQAGVVAYVATETAKPAHHVDVAANGSYACVVSVSRDTSGSTVNNFTNHVGVATFSVVDRESGATLYTSAPIYDVDHIRVVYLATADVFVVVWRDNTNIYARSFAASNPASQASLLTQRTLLTTTVGRTLFDAVQCSGEGSYFYLVTQDDAGPATYPVSLHRVTASGSPVGDNFTVSTFAVATTPNGPKVALSACATKGEQVYIMAATSVATTSIRCYVSTESTGAFSTNTAIETAPTVTSKYIVSGICRVSSTRAAFAFTRYEMDWTRNGAYTANDFGPCTFVGSINSDGTIPTGGSPTTRGTPWTILASRPFLDGTNSRLYAFLVSAAAGHSKDFDATPSAANAVQETGELSDIAPGESLVLCDLMYTDNVAEGVLAADNRTALPRAVTASWTLSAEVMDRNSSANFYQCLPTSVYYLSGASSAVTAFAERVSGDNTAVIRIAASRGGTKYGFTYPGASKASTISGGVFYGGGIPGYYDGTRCGEVGFLTVPWTFLYAAIAAGGSLAAGYYAYQYCFVRIYRDGSVVRSPMSLPTTSFHIVGGSGNYTINLQIPVPGLTEWVHDIDGTAFAQNTYLEIYRSFGASAASTDYTLYARLPTFHGPMVMSYRWGDDGLVANPPGLADPSELTVSLCQPPCFTHHTVHKGRVFGISDGVVWYSNEAVASEGLRFPISNQIVSPGTPFTAVASMESVLVLFSKDKIWILSGEGPDDLGQGSDYAAPQPLPASFGTTHARSVVEWPGGVGFMGPDGLIYNLNRGYAVDFMGEGIQETVSTSCIDAAHISTEAHLVFVVLANAVKRKFVFDYQMKVWFEDTFHADVGVPTRHLDRPGSLQMLCPNGLFYQDTVYYDTDYNGVKRWQDRKLKFGPMCSSGNPEGWQRVRAISFLGEKKSSVGWTVNLYENFSSTPAKTKSKTAATMDGQTAIGDTFNEEVNVKNPENQSVEVEVLDVAPASSADYGEGFHFLGLSFDTELQNGMSRKASTRKG